MKADEMLADDCFFYAILFFALFYGFIGYVFVIYKACQFVC